MKYCIEYNGDLLGCEHATEDKAIDAANEWWSDKCDWNDEPMEDDAFVVAFEGDEEMIRKQITLRYEPEFGLYGDEHRTVPC